MPARLLAVLSASALLALVAAGCGEERTAEPEGEATEQVAEGTEETTAAEPAAEEPAAEEPAAGGKSSVKVSTSKDLDKKPEVPKQAGDPPTELQTDDIVEGKGPAVKAGETISMQYVGESFSNGTEFDASWERGEPFTFELGGGQVIAGWDQGIVGMKKGGRRQLTIPPDLGYGPQGSPPSIAPNETLVFVVDLEKIGA